MLTNWCEGGGTYIPKGNRAISPEPGPVKVIRAWPQWSPAKRRHMDDRLIPEIMDHVRNGTGNRFVAQWCSRVPSTRLEKVP